MKIENKALGLGATLGIIDTDKFKNSYLIFEYKLYEPSGNSKSSIIEYLTKTKPEV